MSYAAAELDAIVAAVLAGSSDDLEHAKGLPPAAYTSRAFYDLEIERIFKKDWLCLGHVSQVASVGDYFTLGVCARKWPRKTERVKEGIAHGPAGVPQEDQHIDEMQQGAASSSLLRGGRLSHLEATVWHLAEYVRARIRD